MTEKQIARTAIGVVAVWLFLWVFGVGVLVYSKEYSTNSRDCYYLLGVSALKRIANSDHCPFLKDM